MNSGIKPAAILIEHARVVLLARLHAVAIAVTGVLALRVLLVAFVSFALIDSLRIRMADGAGVKNAVEFRNGDFSLDFSGYTGGSLDQWLKARGFTFERDAKNRSLLQLSIANDALILEAKGRLTGFLLNDSVNVEKVRRIRIKWGVIQYAQEVSYVRQVNNEALMLYIFFGREKISSGHVLIPNSPYFIGLFLCEDERTNFPYKGRYFQTGGRFVCLGKPQPGDTIVSEFDLDAAFKRYFDKNETPGITGIGFGVDTTKAGKGGTAAALIKSIEFVDGDRTPTPARP
jgi:hypothetical protein